MKIEQPAKSVILVWQHLQPKSTDQWPIDKLTIWRANYWTKYELRPGRFTLRIHYDQLVITSDTKVLQSFNMNSKMKGIYKEDILILIVFVTGQEIRKLKFQIKVDVAQCLYKLKEHFPVLEHNSLQSKNTVPSKYRNIDEVLEHALALKESPHSDPLPPIYGSFVKMCLLDPTFPQVVHDVNKILQEEVLKNKHNAT